MQQWNGLLRKEWVMMKWQLLVGAVFAVAVLAAIPVVISGTGATVFEVALFVSFLGAITSLLMPLVIFFIILERDMKRPDVWLHSTASIFKLIGSKVIFSLLVGGGGLLLSTFILSVYYALYNETLTTFNELLFSGSLFIGMAFIVSIVFLSVGFFFWVVDRLMKPYLKQFSIIATVILFVIASRLYGMVVLSPLYEKLVLIGPIDVLKLKNPKIEMDFVYWNHSVTFFYTGEVLFNTLCIIMVFILASVLFEKKVRL